MKIILNPTIHVLSTPQFHEHPNYKIPSDGNDIVKICSFAAKGCYDSYGETGRSNTDNQLGVLDHGHGSVLEHGVIVLFIEGISRGLTLEMNRHRNFGISQRSTRYTTEDDASIVLEPYIAELYKKHNFYYDELCGVFKPYHVSDDVYPTTSHIHERSLVSSHVNSMLNLFGEYKYQVDLLMKLNPLKLTGFDLRKWARGKARNILPHSLETRVTYSANIRAWRWFVECRTDKHAEPEIRRLANAVGLVLKNVDPVHFSDYTFDTWDSIPEWSTPHQKI